MTRECCFKCPQDGMKCTFADGDCPDQFLTCKCFTLCSPNKPLKGCKVFQEIGTEKEILGE